MSSHKTSRCCAIEKWKDMRFGMFITWGPVSLTGQEIGWSRANPTPTPEYDSLFRRWNPTGFNAREWAGLAKRAGAKYIVLIVKHHDGFCLWDTQETDHNIMKGPFGRDVTDELAEACREEQIGFFPYYSTCDWRHPDFPVTSPGRSMRYPSRWIRRSTSNLDRYTEYLEAQCKELITKYGPLTGLWFDVPQCFDRARGERVIRFLRTLQSDILVNNRLGASGDFDTPENIVGHFQAERAWETNATLQHQWSWKPDDTVRSFEECLRMLVVCACGDGNFLLNLGPMPDGRIEPQQAMRFRELGTWLEKYGESIYGTRGGPFRSPDEMKRVQPGYYGEFTIAGCDYWGGSTRRGNAIYLHILRWPSDVIMLPPIEPHSIGHMDGAGGVKIGLGTLPSITPRIIRHSVLTGGLATLKQTEHGIEVSVPAAQRDPVDTIVKLELDCPVERLTILLSPIAKITHDVISPRGRIALSFCLIETGAPVYEVTVDGVPVLLESRMGLATAEGASFLDGLKVTGVDRGSHDETWAPVVGERNVIRDCYNSLTVMLETATGHKLQLEIRAYEEGAGFRYTIPKQDGLKELTITDEVTEFRFTGNHTCWPVYAAQDPYVAGHKLSDVKKECERPLTVEIEGGPCVAIGEAGMLDYFRMRLQPSDRPNAVRVMPNEVVTGTAPFSTPWRVVQIGETPGQLLEDNHLILNFNPPCAIADTSWIKPGKVFRSMDLSTESGKASIDFAAERGIQYILFDAGWYGPWRKPESDASKPYTECPGHLWTRADNPKPLDILEVVRYGNTKGIGVILYVDRAELEKQGPQLYPLFREWGVKGVKYGFVQVGTQYWAKWIYDQVRLCAENRLMVDIHDEYRPTGFERTWPNLMTCEGVDGDEGFPEATDGTAKPFTRGLCGAFDNTVCIYTPRLTNEEKSKKSRAYQLAKAVMVYSPLQHLFWYDLPEDFRGEPEMEFLKQIPASWHELRVVNGVIGQYVTIARRHGREWYIGTLNANELRTLKIPLRFLKPHTDYRAEIYHEGEPGSREPEALNKIRIETRIVTFGSVIEAVCSDIGGQCIRLVPLGA